MNKFTRKRIKTEQTEQLNAFVVFIEIYFNFMLYYVKDDVIQAHRAKV